MKRARIGKKLVANCPFHEHGGIRPRCEYCLRSWQRSSFVQAHLKRSVAGRIIPLVSDLCFMVETTVIKNSAASVSVPSIVLSPFQNDQKTQK